MRAAATLLADLRHHLSEAEIRSAMPDQDSVAGVCPAVAVTVRTADDVARTLAYADAHGLKVVLRGGGTHLALGNPPTGGDILLILAQDQIIEHAPQDMTVTVAAGMPLWRLQETLAQTARQWLALDPAIDQAATVGGMVATNASGAHRLLYGGVRDHIIGVEVALADGTLARGGGKVVKNVAGYDLPKLFTGSLGTLGAITAATFRLYPLPVAAQRIVYTSPNLAVLGELALRVLAAPLTPATLDLAPAHPPDLAYRLAISFEMSPAGIAEQLDALQTLAGDLAANAVIHALDPLRIWQVPHDAPHHMATNDQAGVLLKASVLPSGVVRWVQALEHLAHGYNLLARWQAHAGHGIIFAALTLPDHFMLDEPNAASMLTEMRTVAVDNGGSLVVQACPPALTRLIDPWGPVAALDLMRHVKEQFDPHTTLNPGRFVGGM